MEDSTWPSLSSFPTTNSIRKPFHDAKLSEPNRWRAAVIRRPTNRDRTNPRLAVAPGHLHRRPWPQPKEQQETSMHEPRTSGRNNPRMNERKPDYPAGVKFGAKFLSRQSRSWDLSSVCAKTSCSRPFSF